MIGLGRWLIAGTAALGVGAAAALVRRERAARAGREEPSLPPLDPPSGRDPEAALEQARRRLRERADEVKARLEDTSD